MVRLGVSTGYRVDPVNKGDLRLKIFSCPDAANPIQDFESPNGRDEYVFRMNYYYVGGASTWAMANPAFSPIKPEDPGTWALMVDTICENPVGSGTFTFLAHKDRDRRPAGANHLFNDGHVEWIKWNGGSNMRANTYWAAQEFYFWRRTTEAP